MKIAIIGGGAAGFFSAITAKETHPNAQVVIFEKSQTTLSKVKVSGGGRCNVTNDCPSITELCKAYPRGGKSLKKAFQVFNNKHAIEWFESRGVALTIQDDHCVFPQSQNAQSIIDCFQAEAKKLGITIHLGAGINAIRQKNERLELVFDNKKPQTEIFDKVIVATGGSPKRSGLEWLEALNHKIALPVPSLFSFNLTAEPITQLMGVVVENVILTIQATKIKSNGPLLITHWGMSGPSILKLSSFGARILNELDYKFKMQVNWVSEANNNLVTQRLLEIAQEHPNKLLSNHLSFPIPNRLWLFLLDKCDISQKKKWSEIGKKDLNKLVNILTNDEYAVNGRAKFTEEFVTCGGVSLDCIDLNTMESRAVKNLYFAGEVMDIDGITGGFNFQNAWTTGFIAGKLA